MYDGWTKKSMPPFSSRLRGWTGTGPAEFFENSILECSGSSQVIILIENAMIDIGKGAGLTNE
ncbi:hypothetical protein BEQ56_08175 [Anaerolineaceae bacterium oral taxon 439]|nr:hypothetical protein BEQ56_08175 [Anaerolineaceae bacterium oral taxon 439]